MKEFVERRFEPSADDQLMVRRYGGVPGRPAYVVIRTVAEDQVIDLVVDVERAKRMVASLTNELRHD